MIKRLVALGALVGGVAGTVAGARVASQFREHQRAAEVRLRSGSRVARTAQGLVEYADVGAGPAVLVSHGSLGGYDQGLMLAEILPNHRVVAVSRPGYLRTPLSAGPGLEQQGDMFAALLDTLGIERAAVVGISAGGPPAMHFAIRHPDRCRALVLLASGALPMPKPPAVLEAFGAVVLGSDFAVWAMTQLLFERLLRATGGTPDGFERLKANPKRYADLRALFSAPLASQRAPGQANDIRLAATLPVEGLGQIQAPTLVVHGSADALAPLAGATYLAQRIPGARLVVAQGGGHTAFATHEDELVPEVVRFLEG
jgi:pimeloyl-ACP methyl ester carboxylesterase